MNEQYSTQRLLNLRRSTRTISDLLRSQMKEHLSTLAPLFQPRTVLGSYAETSAYEASRIGEKAFKELQDSYTSIAQSKLYRLPSDLKVPLEVINTQLEMTPVEYTHVASNGGVSKTVTITSPLKWALTFKGFGPARLRQTVVASQRTNDDLQQFVLHYLMMHSVVTNQPGLSQILEALHFPLVTEYSEEFGSLPLTFISSSISTLRPPDDVLIESTEVSGMDAFEELVQLEDVDKLRDPLKEKLMAIAQSANA